MQTKFTAEQLKDPAIARSNKILRACVHCGFCTATCPTYQVLGDELDSPRGRIYLIKDMLENDRPADAKTVKHIDRCLSCLACMTTCPSGVHYMHLVDHARAHIERTYKRPSWIGCCAGRWRGSCPIRSGSGWRLLGAKIGRPLRGLMPDARLRAMLEMAPQTDPAGQPQRRSAGLSGDGDAQDARGADDRLCATALNTDINDATIRLLRRLGCEVVIARGMGCCGALVHHMGKEDESHARRNGTSRLDGRVEGDGLDAVVINTVGCGTTVKDYGHMFRNGPLAEALRAYRSLRWMSRNC